MRMARVAAAEAVPWMAPALFAARLVLTDQIPFPAAVDRAMRVYVHPDEIGRLLEEHSLKEALPYLATFWVHEVWHVMRGHAERIPHGAPALRWNLACDLEINDWLPPGLKVSPLFPQPEPRDYHLPEGKLAEWYYAHLPDETEQQDGGHSSRHGKDGETQASANRSAEEGTGQRDEGSGVHGQPRVWEMDEASGSPGLTEMEVEQVRLTVAQMLMEAKSRGDVPAGWVRWAEQLLKPVVDWRTMLLRRVRGAIAEGIGNRLDYRYARPHRRSSALFPLLLPSLQGDYRPRVACVVDTSGSISDRELGQALGEVRGVLEQLRAPVTVIPCDAVPYEALQVLNRRDWLNLRGAMKGGGGTDMVAGIEACLRLDPAPDAVVVLTDGHTPYPEHTYAIPVVFALWKVGSGDPPKPPMPPWRPRDVVVVPVKSVD